MSFAGHVFDMIHRFEQNRAQLKLRRERQKGRKGTYLHADSLTESNITVEELEKMERELKEWDLERQRYSFKWGAIILVSLLVATLIGWAIIVYLL